MKKYIILPDSLTSEETLKWSYFGNTNYTEKQVNNISLISAADMSYTNHNNKMGDSLAVNTMTAERYIWHKGKKASKQQGGKHVLCM